MQLDNEVGLFIYDILIKTKTPQHQEIKLKITQTEVQEFLKLLKFVHEDMKNCDKRGYAYPCKNQFCFHCSKKV
jgi:hypothetical protein